MLKLPKRPVYVRNPEAQPEIIFVVGFSLGVCATHFLEKWRVPRLLASDSAAAWPSHGSAPIGTLVGADWKGHRRGLPVVSILS